MDNELFDMANVSMKDTKLPSKPADRIRVAVICENGCF